MKKMICLLSVIACCLAAFAQTPQEIVARMESEMDKHESEGMIMTVATKMPIVGTVTMKNYILGDKMRSETKLLGQDVIMFTDGVTEWTCMPKANKIKITNHGESSSSGSSENESEMFSDITDGYDLTLSRETADAWYFTCKKSKSNKDKDAPKTIDLAVSKGTYYPKLLKAKASGITITLSDVSFGVDEKFVTFNLNDYPGAEVEDAREKK